MIPFYFNLLFDFNSRILTYKNGEYPFLKKYCPNLKLSFIKKSKHIKSYEKNILRYLFRNAKRIDFLNLIHPHSDNYIFGLVYKWINKKGFLYLKMDIQDSFKQVDLFRQYRIKGQFQGPLNLFYFYLMKKIINIFFKKVDLISAESKELVDFIKKKYPQLRDKMVYIPNGVDDFYIKKKIKDVGFDEKSNIILTVGRIGTEQKSNEVLLEAVSKIKDLKNWKILLAGPIEKSFKVYMQQFFQYHPNLKDKIFLIGKIERKKLYEYFQKSKIFCLTSAWESFGLVLVEAGYFGNFIVSTDLSSSRDITDNGKLGQLFPIGDSTQLAFELEKLINDEDILKKNYNKIKKHIDENFNWSLIINRLYIHMKKKLLVKSSS